MKDLLIKALGAAVLKFDGESVYSADELRKELSNGERDEFEHSKLGSASVEVADGHVRALADHLRERLGRFVEAETDRIGHSFQVVGDGDARTTVTSDFHVSSSAVSTVTSLAKGIVRAGAIIGPCRATDLMEQLIRGEPQRRKLCVMLDGIHAGGMAEMSEGVAPLPFAALVGLAALFDGGIGTGTIRKCPRSHSPRAGRVCAPPVLSPKSDRRCTAIIRGHFGIG